MEKAEAYPRQAGLSFLRKPRSFFSFHSCCFLAFLEHHRGLCAVTIINSCTLPYVAICQFLETMSTRDRHDSFRRTRTFLWTGLGKAEDRGWLTGTMRRTGILRNRSSSRRLPPQAALPEAYRFRGATVSGLALYLYCLKDWMI